MSVGSTPSIRQHQPGRQRAYLKTHSAVRDAPDVTSTSTIALSAAPTPLPPLPPLAPRALPVSYRGWDSLVSAQMHHDTRASTLVLHSIQHHPPLPNHTYTHTHPVPARRGRCAAAPTCARWGACRAGADRCPQAAPGASCLGICVCVGGGGVLVMIWRRPSIDRSAPALLIPYINTTLKVTHRGALPSWAGGSATHSPAASRASSPHRPRPLRRGCAPHPPPPRRRRPAVEICGSATL